VHDKRDIQRTRVMRDAKIIVSQHDLMVDCTILDLTNQGAGLNILHSFLIPESFAITLDKGRTLRTGRVMWRCNERLGVAFKHPPLSDWRIAATQTSDVVHDPANLAASALATEGPET
jgi:hypothetical protein